MALYRDVLAVLEYSLFDPLQDYLKPSMQGYYRLAEGRYKPIEPVEGRLPSVAPGMLLERDGSELRLIDPTTGRRLLTSEERTERERIGRLEAEAENDRLRRDLEEFRGKTGCG
jgi:hypothetical protein